MKKLMSILLVLVLLLTLAPMALAEEEPVDEPEPAEAVIEEEPAAEADEPALDGLDTLEVWIEPNGKINWKSYPGATEYIIRYAYPTGGNASISDLTDADKPFDLTAYFDDRVHPSGTYDIYVQAGWTRNTNGAFVALANSGHFDFEYASSYLTLPKPNAWWDGTTVRWEPIDLTPYATAGATADNICVDVRLYEDNTCIMSNYPGGGGVPLSQQGTSWDASAYIEMPDREYKFYISLRAKDSSVKIANSATFFSETVLGRELTDGYSSRAITAAAISVTAPQAGKAIPAAPDGIPAPGSYFTIGEQYWCDGMSVSWGKLTSGTFVNGTTYYYYAELVPDAGYEFPGTAGWVSEDDLTVTANGVAAASMAKGSGGKVTVYIPMKATGPVFNDDIVLTGFTEPRAGASVQSNASASGSGYTVTSQKWSDGWLGLSATKDTTFQDGKTYFWIGTVTLDDGYGFAENYTGKLKLNGSTVTPTTGDILSALENGDPVRTIDASNATMVIRLSYKPGSSQPSATDYVLDLSGASVSGSEVSGTGKLLKSDGSAPDGKKYVYIVVNYERPDGSTWAVAGTYAVDSDGEFDLPSITGVSDKVSSVLVIGVDSKTGANWAGHNVTKPGRIKPQ